VPLGHEVIVAVDREPPRVADHAASICASINPASAALSIRNWVGMERSMKCGIGLCGHCQLAGSFVCKDGPVFRYDRMASLMRVREL